MVEAELIKTTDIIYRIRSKAKDIDVLCEDLRLWLISEQNNNDNHEIDDVAIMHNIMKMEHTAKMLRKNARILGKIVSLYDSTQRKALKIIESAESFVALPKEETLKINDLTEVGKLVSEYKFDVS